MLPLADTHVHLLAGLDDGPPRSDIALAMCRMLVSEATGHATALAHQNPDYPKNSATRLRAAAAGLVADLADKGIPLHVYPAGEVMLTPTVVEDYKLGHLLTVGDHGKWLLVEMPHGQFLDIVPIAEAFKPLGVRL